MKLYLIYEIGLKGNENDFLFSDENLPSTNNLDSSESTSLLLGIQFSWIILDNCMCVCLRNGAQSQNNTT